MAKFLKFTIMILLIFNLLAVFSSIAYAEGLLPAESGNANCPKDPATGNPIKNCGNYSLNDMANTAITVSQFILGIVGSLALLAFVAGGLMWILSAGNTEWVTRGKQTILGAVIGLVIVFTSYMIIQLVYSALGIDAATKNGAWSTFTGKNDWFK